jgi:lipid-A-disaccharide synthase
MNRQVMIVTGEASGDLHGARLVRALRAADPSLRFCGMGGEELASCGVDLLFPAARVSVVGIFEVFAHLGDIFRALRILRRRLTKDPPGLLILIDLPDFNLLLAKTAKKLKIPVFYYITPQVWAWRSGRVRSIAQRVDQLAVILPFEEDFFRRRGLAARYVGHPLLDSVHPEKSEAEFRRRHDIPPEAWLVGLLPGSRQREVATLLPIFLAAAEELQRQTPRPLVFCIPRATSITREQLDRAGLAGARAGLTVRVFDDDRYAMMAACRAALAASGTVTLELAILGVPLVVTYRLNPLSYALGRALVRLDHFCLVNLIAGFRAVPELLQGEVTATAIVPALAGLVVEGEKREKMLADLALVREKLGQAGASERAAAMALAMLERRR